MQSVRQCTGASTSGRVAPVQPESCTPRSHHYPALPASSRLRSLYRLNLASSAARAQSRYPQRQQLSRCQPQCVHSRAVQCSAVSSTWDVSERPAPVTRTVQRAAVFTAAFAIYFCISWLTRPAAAVASATSALTSAGASRAAAQSAVRSGYAGLAAGCLHSLAGVDHLAALAPFTIGRNQVTASLLGALWGFGHSAGQLFMGLLMIILKDRFQHIVPALNQAGTLTVGFTLVAIGLLGVREALEHQRHHASVSQPITTEGVLIQDVAQRRPDQGGLKSSLGIFATGVVHGCNPDALFVIIPALTLPTKLAAMTYTVMFVLGTVGAMGGYTALIGAISSRASETVNSRMAGGASMLAVAVGVAILLSGWGVPLPFGLSIG